MKLGDPRRIAVEDLLISSLHRSANMWIFIYLKSSFTWMFICNQFIDQLPVGLLAQLVERCTGIAEVMGSNPVRAWNFFRSYLQLLVSVVFLSCEDLPSNVMFWWIKRCDGWEDFSSCNCLTKLKDSAWNWSNNAHFHRIYHLYILAMMNWRFAQTHYLTKSTNNDFLTEVPQFYNHLRVPSLWFWKKKK